jgi:hypothetical protein
VTRSAGPSAYWNDGEYWMFYLLCCECVSVGYETHVVKLVTAFILWFPLSRNIFSMSLMSFVVSLVFVLWACRWIANVNLEQSIVFTFYCIWFPVANRWLIRLLCTECIQSLRSKSRFFPLHWLFCVCCFPCLLRSTNRFDGECTECFVHVVINLFVSVWNSGVETCHRFIPVVWLARNICLASLMVFVLSLFNV